MKDKLAIAFGAGFIALAGYFGYNSISDLGSAQKALNANSKYVRFQTFLNAGRNVHSAIHDLDYQPSRTETVNRIDSKGNSSLETKTHPPVYPDGIDARRKISIALKDLGDFLDVDDSLRTVYDLIPNQNNIREFKGKKVDKNTFSNQRDSLRKVESSISLEKNKSFQMIPKNLLKAKNIAVGKIAGCSLGLIAGLISIVYGFSNYKPIFRNNLVEENHFQSGRYATGNRTERY